MRGLEGLLALAAGTHGVFTTSEARALGVSVDALRWAARNLPATDSELETRFWQEWRARSGPRMPERRVEVHRHGRLLGVVDFLFREEGGFLECDGDFHNHAPNRRADRIRRRLISTATGWTPTEVEWDDVVRRPASTVRGVAAWLDTLAARASPFPRTDSA